MKISNPDDVSFLPNGDLTLVKSDVRVPANVYADYTKSAARALLDRGCSVDAFTQADVVKLAINQLHWGLGSKSYRAE